MSAFSCCAGIHKTKTGKRALFVMLVILNLSDLIADWLLYDSVSRLQQGLVYGPVDPALKLSLKVFAIIGSVLFPLEIINAALKTFGDNYFVNIDVVSAFVLWFTDVPQTIINVIIAACREELVGNFQIAKGAVVITGCAIRLMLVLLRYCTKKHLKEIPGLSHETRCRVAVRFLVVIGIILTCLGSVLVFIFSQFHQVNGVLQPYNSQRYFENVGIFVDPNTVYPGGNLTSSNLIKVGSIQDVMVKDSHFTVRYRLESGTNSRRVTIAKQLGSQSFQVTQCFRLSLAPELNVTSELPVSSCSDVTTANADDTVFLFQYKIPAPSIFNRHIFGEIYFNVGRSFTKAILTLNHGGVGGPVGYFRYVPAISGQQDLLFPQTSLLDIKEFWKTGYFMCESSGSLSPIWDPSLTIANSYFL